MKIKNLDDLIKLKEENSAHTILRRIAKVEEHKKHELQEQLPDGKRMQLIVCGGTGCVSSESKEIMQALQLMLEAKKIEDVEVIQSGCFGFCGQGPIIKVFPDNVFYVKVDLDDVEEIIESHIKNGVMVERLLYVDPSSKERIHHHEEMNFYEKQQRVALRNCGTIDPENINDYIAYDGYQALAKVLEDTPENLIDIMLASGLRGRGGGGFPTGLKWKFAKANESEKKYIICNADEGDPGAFMDRSILEGDPQRVLEAMAIAGYAIGSDHGIIYIRAEYPLAIFRVETAIDQAREYGLLGENILGTGFSFDVEIRLGAGAFVCGEETALIHSVEGMRGEPTRKPPFPAESGYEKKPTIVNNVETLANIPEIILQGPEWFSSIGTENSKGTKVFALAGKVNNVGLVEVPMGTTVREIVYDIGGGVPDGRTLKAVQTGGPSGGVITEKDFDTPIDYENLKAIGSMMGSGGMIIMDDQDDMIEISKFYLQFTQEESCGKCTACRIGSKRLYELLCELTDLKGSVETLNNITNLCNYMKESCLCALGQTAPNPVLSTMKYFPMEYERYAKHLVSKQYKIMESKCIGCTRCAKNCPVSCISGEVRKPHVIDPEQCVNCGSCFSVCPVKAVLKPGQMEA